MGLRESKVESYLDSEVAKLGGITRKWTSPGRCGVPDRIVIVSGIVVFVEVKTISGVLSQPQRREIKRLEAAGARVFAVYGQPGVDKFISIMKGVLENVTNNNTRNGEWILH